jgi:hypothetical protein
MLGHFSELQQATLDDTKRKNLTLLIKIDLGLMQFESAKKLEHYTIWLIRFTVVLLILTAALVCHEFWM